MLVLALVLAHVTLSAAFGKVQGLNNDKLAKANAKIDSCKENKCYSLQLVSSELLSVPPSVWSMDWLQELNLNTNKIYALPARLGGLSKLLLLDLGNNNFHDLPEIVCSLTNLEDLRIGNNPLAKVPDCVSQLTKLKKVQAQRLTATEVPEVFTKLPALEELYLNQNSFKAIPKNLPKTLKTLVMTNNQLEDLPAELANLPNLELLSLGSNPLGQLRGLALPKLANLKRLDLGWGTYSALPETLFSLTGLEELNLMHSQKLQTSSLLGLAKFPKLKTLDISGCLGLVLPAGVEAKRYDTREAVVALFAKLTGTPGPVRPSASSSTAQKQEEL